MSLTAASVTVLSATSNGWSGPSAGGWIPDVFARRLLAESAGSPSGFSGMPVLRVGGPGLAHDSGPRSRAGSIGLEGVRLLRAAGRVAAGNGHDGPSFDVRFGDRFARRFLAEFASGSRGFIPVLIRRLLSPSAAICGRDS